MDNKAYIFALLAALGAVGGFLYTELNKISVIQGQRGGEEIWLTRWMDEREKRFSDRDAFIDRYLDLRDTQFNQLKDRVIKLESRIDKMK